MPTMVTEKLTIIAFRPDILSPSIPNTTLPNMPPAASMLRAPDAMRREMPAWVKLATMCGSNTANANEPIGMMVARR